MKLLLLSCNTGEGHNSAARAIREELEAKGHQCDIMDALAFASPRVSRAISRLHTFAYCHMPHMFGAAYNLEEKFPSLMRAAMCTIISRGARRLKKRVLAYDGVICVHIFGAMMMTKVKKCVDIPAFFVSTDYTCCPCAAKENMDAFFIPHASLVGEFIVSGANANKLIPSGIPVSAEFCSKKAKADARRELGLCENGKVILIASGSIGCGRIARLTRLLSEKCADARIAVICGRNEKTYKRISRLNASNIISVGYTDKMSLYMDAADVFLTKAGGLCTSEAAAKGLATVLMNAVPGCESRNIRFFISNGLALTGKADDDLANAVGKLIYGKTISDSIRAKIEATMPKNAASAIAEYAQSYIEAYERESIVEMTGEIMQNYPIYALYDEMEYYAWEDEDYSLVERI